MIEERILSGAAELGIEIDERALQGLTDYLRLLLLWNQTYNLTAAKSETELVERHLLDSLTLYPYLQEGELLDVGCGAGLPGLPLAIIDPARKVYLLDSNRKKTRFVRQCAVSLRLEMVSVLEQRIENTARGGYANITARAVAPLGKLLELTVPLLRDEGVLLAQKGSKVNEEIEQIDTRWPGELSLCQLPVLGGVAQSYLAVFRRKSSRGHITGRF